MNDTVTLYALALASNHHPQPHFQTAYHALQQLGTAIFSDIYVMPCRDGVGADYWNACCLLSSHLSVDVLSQTLKQLEQDSGRIRPSHQISLDVDLIAWGSALPRMHFNPKKLPLALDVKIPMQQIWQHELFSHVSQPFPILHL